MILKNFINQLFAEEGIFVKKKSPTNICGILLSLSTKLLLFKLLQWQFFILTPQLQEYL